jgi:hypothetical protein
MRENGKVIYLYLNGMAFISCVHPAKQTMVYGLEVF